MPLSFRETPEPAWLCSNALAFAVRRGALLVRQDVVVAPRARVASWFDAPPELRAALLDLVDEVKHRLDAELRPTGYDLRIDAGDDGPGAPADLHVCVIPRFRSDPGDASLARGGAADPFLDHLVPLFARATEIAVVAAFVLETGLRELEGHLVNALARGARVRVLTGNYLAITQAVALRTLLAWSGGAPPGRLEARIVDMTAPRPPGVTFHPKSWRLEGPDFGVAFVGSSNISRAALHNGVEWNLRVDRSRDPHAYHEVARAFDRLWGPATLLTPDWIDAYARRLHDAPSAVAAAFAVADEEAPMPHDVQYEALAALVKSREEGRRRALVVLATGLGKTWLSAFDAHAYGRDRLEGRTPRILFIAHREEILAQAERTFRRMFHAGRPTTGFFAGDRSELDADLVFASVQKLARPEHLAKLASMRFDYAVVDEVHHAPASSYRAILDGLDAGFLLGLTATPERADGADVLGLFDEHVAFRADIATGIQRKLLVPFAYWGLKDEIDYTGIAWKNQRFDPDQLARAVDTEGRLAQMWKAWEAHPGTRTLVFCSTIDHAEHARAFLEAKGVRVRSVHTGPGSSARAAALAALETGEADALCAVDILNEGVDVPAIDRVVMLRPTESPVVFLQQLGRGLRRAAGKARLVVLDFIGNHRVFLDRLRMLASLGEQGVSVRDLVAGPGPENVLPGCPVEIALEAKDLLRHLLAHSAGGKTAAERAYLEIVDARGIRPTAGELFRMGYAIKDLVRGEEGWFDFVAKKGGLHEAELRVFDAAKDWWRDLETTKMVRSFKMVTLEALLESGEIRHGLPVADLSRRSYAILRRSPDLFREIEGVEGLEDPEAPDEARFLAYWTQRKNPIDAWISGRDGGPWFARKDDRFVPLMPIPPGDEAAFVAMTRELVDYRLARYRERAREEASVTALPLRRLTAYPSLRAAAGAVSDPVEGEPEPTTVALPTRARGKGLFAVRATGDSMNGFQRPIRDGDWVVLRATPGASPEDLAGKVALCRIDDREGGQSFQIKRVVRAGEGYILRSDNPSATPRSYEVTEETKLLAVRVDVVRPEDVWSPREGKPDEEAPPGSSGEAS